MHRLNQNNVHNCGRSGEKLEHRIQYIIEANLTLQVFVDFFGQIQRRVNVGMDIWIHFLNFFHGHTQIKQILWKSRRKTKK
jgi:hypothetical protein